MAEYCGWSERWESIASLATAETTMAKAQRLIFFRIGQRLDIGICIPVNYCIFLHYREYLNLMSLSNFHSLMSDVLKNIVGSLLTREINLYPPISLL